MQLQRLSDCYTLANGVKIPCLGFGTWQMPNDETTTGAVLHAIKTGYRHIDTAAAYKNEVSVGKGIAQSGIARSELFVTTKLWNPDQGYQSTLDAFDRSLNNLGLDYVDLYLIHWPVVKGHKDDWRQANLDTWRAFEELYKAGKIRAIGLSNFLPEHIDNILHNCTVAPMVDQIELHPGFLQSEVVDYCRAHNILVEAWSPLATGKMFAVPLLQQLAEKYQRSIAQICLRWLLQKQILPLPKSTHAERIENNADIFDFVLAAEDCQAIDALEYCGGSGLDPHYIDL